MSRKLWLIALAVWFLLYGILAVTNIRFDAERTVMGILAIAVAVLAFLDK